VTVRYTLVPTMTQTTTLCKPDAIILHDMNVCMMYVMRNVIKIRLSLLDLCLTT